MNSSRCHLLWTLAFKHSASLVTMMPRRSSQVCQLKLQPAARQDKLYLYDHKEAESTNNQGHPVQTAPLQTDPAQRDGAHGDQDNSTSSPWTLGVHTLQVMHGCEWDDETGEVSGHYRLGYDGEDFTALDLKTLTWIAENQLANITKHQWDNDEGRNKYLRYYLKTQCPEQLKKLLHYGNSSLLRTELPSVSLLQKTPSSPIVCHATGFYPPRAILFWTKDGEELLDDVDIGEVLPNPDGTFQMRTELKLRDPSEAWERFTCVFYLAGVVEALHTSLDKEAILTKRKKDQTIPIAVSVAALVLLVAAAAVIGVVMRRRAGKSTETVTNISEGHTLALNPLTEDPAHGESLRNILKETREEKLL
ncbi:major histocompatibility complex class I-related gene protein-like isoform X5 [Synchiropus splendidus]|uniref:major histocompatibility complex class I-related gene protein-like isoform X5 n=1 Tax=Synchiropus splendidus TaxID=270530 RepID=UPI00237E4285|nr:major histocompatibility complex class I-related gene protein-like isoform X5 [Synchiropus splendidus]